MKPIHNFKSFNESIEEEYIDSQNQLSSLIEAAENILKQKIEDPIDAVTELYDMDDPKSIELAQKIEDEIESMDNKEEEIER